MQRQHEVLLLAFGQVNRVDSNNVSLPVQTTGTRPVNSLQAHGARKLSIQAILRDDRELAERLAEHAEVVDLDLGLGEESHLATEVVLLLAAVLVAALIHRLI